MQIIKPRQRRERTTYTLFFRYIDDDQSGFAFPCDEHGNVDVQALQPIGRKSLEDCRGPEAALYEAPTIEKNVTRWTEPAVGRCDCGANVSLGNFTNTCSRCGADYNGSGQRLASREQWGEETGESVDDILSVDCTDTDELLGGDL